MYLVIPVVLLTVLGEDAAWPPELHARITSFMFFGFYRWFLMLFEQVLWNWFFGVEWFWEFGGEWVGRGGVGRVRD